MTSDAAGLDEALRVLLVEDSPPDAELVQALLEETGAAVQVDHVVRLGDALVRLDQRSFDAVLLDLSLPDSTGLEAVRAVRVAVPGTALVVLTGYQDERTALRALGAGAQDYVTKGELAGPLLLRALRYACERVRADAAVQASTRWAVALLDGLDSPTCAVDDSGHVLVVNAAMRSRAGVDLLACLPGQDLPRRWELAGTADGAALQTALRAVLEGRALRTEVEVRTPDGRWWTVRTTPLPGDAGAVLTTVDITALKDAHELLTSAALHDALTGLPNRTLLRDRLEQAFAHASRSGGAVAVAFLDVDRFKQVNDTLGHAVGDAVLVAVADRLRTAARDTDTVARVSGDEFVVAWVADDLPRAHVAAERLLRAVNDTLVADGRPVPVAVSGGLAVARDGDGPDDVLRAADEAMYAAKAAGGARLHDASAELMAELARRAGVEGELRRALEDGCVEVHYQPVVRLEDGQTTGAEALVRLRGADGRLLPPAEFIDVAERTGLIVPLGAVVLETACLEAAGWDGAAARLSVAVNLSTRQLGQPDVVRTVERALSLSGLDPRRLVLEVTESSVVEDADVALRALRALKDLGVRTAIDDFGTGYSSFLYLKRFPVDILKIDRSFVSGMVDSPDDAAIVRSIVRLGQDIGVELVAEGVEREEERVHLLRLGCTLAQGYLFSPPVPGGSLAAAVVATPRAPIEGDAPLVPAPRDADPVAPAVLERVEHLTTQGASLHTVAAVLNASGLRTSSGRRWHARSVARCLEHLDAQTGA